MYAKVALYLNSTRLGEVQFHTLPVTKRCDYTCKPLAMLTHEQVQELAEEMQQLPLVCEGRIGSYEWREE